MSIFGVFLVLIFTRYSVSLRIQSKCGKIRTRKLQIWTLFYAVTSTKDIPGCKDLDYYIHKHWRCLVNRVLRKITSLLKKDNYFTLSWRMSILHRNQAIDFQSKPMDWFLYDMDHRHEGVKLSKKIIEILLHKKWSFSLRISLVNRNKSAVSWGFGHIYWRNP